MAMCFCGRWPPLLQPAGGACNKQVQQQLLLWSMVLLVGFDAHLYSLGDHHHQMQLALVTARALVLQYVEDCMELSCLMLDIWPLY